MNDWANDIEFQISVSSLIIGCNLASESIYVRHYNFELLYIYLSLWSSSSSSLLFNAKTDISTSGNNLSKSTTIGTVHCENYRAYEVRNPVAIAYFAGKHTHKPLQKRENALCCCFCVCVSATAIVSLKWVWLIWRQIMEMETKISRKSNWIQLNRNIFQA